MERITITITYDAYKLLDEHRKDKYPQYKKISRMMLDMAMDEVRDNKKEKKSETN